MEDLKRLRILLDYGMDLVLVADKFEEGCRYVKRMIPSLHSSDWTWLEWERMYDQLAEEWRHHFS